MFTKPRSTSNNNLIVIITQLIEIFNDISKINIPAIISGVSGNISYTYYKYYGEFPAERVSKIISTISSIESEIQSLERYVISCHDEKSIESFKISLKAHLAMPNQYPNISQFIETREKLANIFRPLVKKARTHFDQYQRLIMKSVINKEINLFPYVEEETFTEAKLETQVETKENDGKSRILSLQEILLNKLIKEDYSKTEVEEIHQATINLVDSGLLFESPTTYYRI